MSDMRMFSKILNLLVLSLSMVFFGFFVARVAFAETMDTAICDNPGISDTIKAASGCPDDTDPEALPGIVQVILNAIVAISGLIAVIFMIVGGVKVMTSSGDSGKVELGRKTVIYSSIGLIVVAVSFAAVNFTINVINNNSDSSGSIDSTDKSSDEASDNDIIAVTPEGSIEIKPSSTRVVVDKNPVFNFTVYLSSALKGQELTWTSSDPTVATIVGDSAGAQRGTLTAKSVGETTITVATAGGESATSKVTVVEQNVPRMVYITPRGNIKITENTSKQLKATILPANATNKSITWSSSDTSVATVTQTGKVTAQNGAAGKTAKITATAFNGVEATVTINVISGDTPIAVTENLLNKLAYYHQTNYLGNNVSCRSGYGAVTCGISTYQAAHYALTGKDTDYHTFTQEACNTGFFNGNGASWDVVAYSGHAQAYKNKYGITGKKIANSLTAIVAELKKGHPVAYGIHKFNGNRTQYGGDHFILFLSYRNDNGGQIFLWNPNTMSEGWLNTSDIQWMISNIFSDWGNAMPWAMWKI